MTAPRDWKAFVLEHGYNVRGHHLEAVVGQPVHAIERLRRGGRCRTLDRPKPFAELFALWHGRSPRDEDWPAPKNHGRGYEILVPELALVARLTGAHSTRAIAETLTTRLRSITGDLSATRTRADVQRMRHRVGLVVDDMQGGLTTREAAKLAGVTHLVVHFEIKRGKLRAFRVGHRIVISRRAFDEWMAQRLPLPPAGWIKLWDLEQQLGLQKGSSRASWYAKNGLIPGALFCAGHRWWVSPDVAEGLLRRRRLGQPMPWTGYTHRSTVKRSYRLWQSRRHQNCADCRALWTKVGGVPRTFEVFFERWRQLAETEKRHLTKPDGLSASQAAMVTGFEKHTVMDAIRAGVLKARRIKGHHWTIRPGDLDRWSRRAVLSTRGGVPRLHQQPLTFRHAAARSRLSLSTLKAAVKAGLLAVVTRWDGQPGLLAHQVSGLRARIGGLSAAEAARRVGISTPAFLREAKTCGWQPGFAITKGVVDAVKKHRKATWQLTIPEAARRLGRSPAWVRAAIAAGVILPLKGDRRERMVGRKAIEAMVRRGVPELPRATRGRPIDWMQQLTAAAHAGVSVTTLLRWRADLVMEERIDGPYYSKTSVERRARRYWIQEAKFKRRRPPAWLTSTSEAA